MPMKYLEEVRSAPTSKLSFPRFLEKVSYDCFRHWDHTFIILSLVSNPK